MTIVNITELRRNLPRLLDRVEAGESVAITRRGKLIARIEATTDARTAARAALRAARAHARVGDVETPIDVDWEAAVARP